MVFLAALFFLGCGYCRCVSDAGTAPLQCGPESSGSGIDSCFAMYGACSNGTEVHDYTYECGPSADGGTGPTQCTRFVDLVPQTTFVRDRICELSETVRQSELRAGCPGWPAF